MKIQNNIDKEKVFRKNAKEIFKNGIPVPKRGDELETIHGVGVVSDIYSTLFDIYPIVSYTFFPVTCTGLPFSKQTLMYYDFDWIYNGAIPKERKMISEVVDYSNRFQ